MTAERLPEPAAEPGEDGRQTTHIRYVEHEGVRYRSREVIQRSETGNLLQSFEELIREHDRERVWSLRKGFDPETGLLAKQSYQEYTPRGILEERQYYDRYSNGRLRALRYLRFLSGGETGRTEREIPPSRQTPLGGGVAYGIQTRPAGCRKSGKIRGGDWQFVRNICSGLRRRPVTGRSY